MRTLRDLLSSFIITVFSVVMVATMVLWLPVLWLVKKVPNQSADTTLKELGIGFIVLVFIAILILMPN